MRKVAENAVLEFPGLASDGMDEPGVAVAQVAGPPGRDCIHVPVAFEVEQEGPFAPRNYRETVPECRVTGIWVPEACLIKFSVVFADFLHDSFFFLT